MDPQDQDEEEILGSGGLNPLLIPDVIRTVLESRRLSVDDLKTCRRVCTDWSTHATTVLSHRSRITIKGTSGMRKFEETFIAGQGIPSRDFKLVEYGWTGNMQDFMTHFSPLFDWPRLEIESLILNIKKDDYHPTPLYVLPRFLRLLDFLSTLLKKTENLTHLAFQYWPFHFKEGDKNLNDLEKVVHKRSKIKSISLNDCFLPDAAALFLLPTFNTVFTELETIDFSNQDDNKQVLHTKIKTGTLVRSFTWSNIKTLRIPEFNTEVIDGLNGTDIKLKHFHADVMTISNTSRDSWTKFLTQQNELESFSIKTLTTEGNSLWPIGYRIPRMEKLRRLHLGGRYGFRCVLERNKIFETCPKLNELIADIPSDMIFTNHQIISLTVENPGTWYSDWLEDFKRISKEYLGLKYLTVKLHRTMDRASVISSLSNIFPDFLELKVIP